MFHAGFGGREHPGIGAVFAGGAVHLVLGCPVDRLPGQTNLAGRGNVAAGRLGRSRCTRPGHRRAEGRDSPVGVHGANLVVVGSTGHGAGVLHAGFGGGKYLSARKICIGRIVNLILGSILHSVPC